MQDFLPVQDHIVKLSCYPEIRLTASSEMLLKEKKNIGKGNKVTIKQLAVPSFPTG